MNQPAFNTLLVELVTEELPARNVTQLSKAFAAGLKNGLVQAGLVHNDTYVQDFAGPRRLAVLIHGVLSKGIDKKIRRKVLPLSIALDMHGCATTLLYKKLDKLGMPNLSINELEREKKGNEEFFYLSSTVKGITLSEALQIAINQTIEHLPIQKMMRYQGPNGESFNFVRPLRRLIALHGGEIVPISVLGLRASRETVGHRFLSSKNIVLTDAASYVQTLRMQGKVIVSFSERREMIRKGLMSAAKNEKVLITDNLLNEVTALIEWPMVYVGHFDKVFLNIPRECLILMMQTNQKYFPLTSSDGSLKPRFLITSNIPTDNPNAIIKGNERVVRARLNDAQFFFEKDKKYSLESRLPKLDSIVYHAKLGSQFERVQRISAISAIIAERLGQDVALASRAARLAKADLVTEMVNEFPELQGIMGGHYAKNDGEPEEIVIAVAEHYRPRFSGDGLPISPIGTIVALADKIETLVGIWGIGLAPTSEKDPFALRRHAFGVVQILFRKSLPLDLTELFHFAFLQMSEKLINNPVEELHTFCLDRLYSLLRENLYKPQEIDAILARKPRYINDLSLRLEAIHAFIKLPQSRGLILTNKRINNILKKSNAKDIISKVDITKLCKPSEQTLAKAISTLTPHVEKFCAGGQYKQVFEELMNLDRLVENFFNDVMINTEEIALRTNRLALLKRLHHLINIVADLSHFI